MLLGEYEHTIDNKGRVILPRGFRDEFEKGMVITKGLDDCLFLYSLKKWEEIEDRVLGTGMSRTDARVFSRIFFSHARHVIPDSQGRILIPTPLREAADLSKEVVIIGLSDRAEIWDPSRWAEYRRGAEESYEQKAEELGL